MDFSVHTESHTFLNKTLPSMRQSSDQNTWQRYTLDPAQYTGEVSLLLLTQKEKRKAEQKISKL
jgi:hypothetical protein